MLHENSRMADLDSRQPVDTYRTDDRSAVIVPLRAIARQFWNDGKWLLLGTAGVALVSSTCAVATPYVFSRLVDRLYSANAATLLLVGFGFYAGLRGITLALTYCVNFLAVIAAEKLNYAASTGFFDRIVWKRAEFFVNHNAAEIQAARENGERAIYILVQLILIVLAPGLAQIGLSLLLLGVTISLEIVFIAVAYGTAFILATYLANKSTRPLLDHAVRASQDNAKFIGGVVHAVETLRYFGGDRWALAEFERRAGQVRSIWGRWARLRIKYAFLFGIGLSVQLTVTFLALLPAYHQGDLSLGDVVLINTLLMQLNQPFEMIGSAIDDVVRSWSRILPFGRIWCAPEEKQQGASSSLHIERGTIKFDALSFCYGPSGGVKDVTFTAERGRLNFIVGETGSGKSTLLKIALKSLEPDSGRIIVDGTDLAAISREQWYAAVGVVPQETVLLNDTIARNIVLGRPYDPEKLVRAIQRAALLPFIQRQPLGIEATVGERGLAISGGERQRIAIARALYTDPRILFLDEASSALDETTEDEIVEELRKMSDEITTIAITHRTSIIRLEDRVLRLGSTAHGMCGT